MKERELSKNNLFAYLDARPKKVVFRLRTSINFISCIKFPTREVCDRLLMEMIILVTIYTEGSRARKGTIAGFNLGTHSSIVCLTTVISWGDYLINFYHFFFESMPTNFSICIYMNHALL